MKTTRLPFILFWLVLTVSAYAQKKQEIGLKADRIAVSNANGVEMRFFRGNVIFSRKTALLYCDSAHQNVTTNSITFMGQPRMVDDSNQVTLEGDTIFYNGATKKLQVVNNVVLKDTQATLTTNFLRYDLESGVGFYSGGGKIVDDLNDLTSLYGQYDRKASLAYFEDSVVLIGEKFTLTTDTLFYNLTTKVADFSGPTTITSESGDILTSKGRYNTKTRKSDFGLRTTVSTPEYAITGDSLSYNRAEDIGKAFGDVFIQSVEDSTIIVGDSAYFSKPRNFAQVIGRVVVKQLVNADTLFIRTDTAFSFQYADTAHPGDTIKKIAAYPNVRIYQNSLQARCDSLVFTANDSVFTFYGDPVLWSSGNQMTGDTIYAYMKEGGLDQLFIRKNGFIINQDTLLNFNQVKGRDITAYFDDSTHIKRVNVDGNGQNIYYALENDTATLGMNKAICSDMVIKFVGKNQPGPITFIGQPDAKFIPPHEITPLESKLPGFIWREEEKPTEAIKNRQIEE